MKSTRMLVVCLAVVAPAALAQKWEFGGGAGGGFNTSNTVTRPTETATAKIKTGVAAGLWLGNNSAARWGGELRYTYQMGEFSVKQNSTEAKFNGESHAIHYDFLWHATDSGSPVRAYIAFGGGIKTYRGTGAEQLTQPLSRFVLLTQTSQFVGMASAGAGIKFKLSPSWQLRLDVHDYMTPFPKDVMALNLGSSAGSWIHNIVPMFGLTWTSK